MADDWRGGGTTSNQIVKIIGRPGAREAHRLIAPPPFRFPCFYGIDVSTRAELMAAHHTVEEMRDLIGVDSLGFLSVGSLIEAINLPNVNGAPNGGLTVAYFTGNYPTPLYDYEEGYRKSLSEQEKLARKEVTV